MLEFLAKNWWYLLIVGAFAFMMFRGGGCCGGGGRSQGGHSHGGQNNGMSGGGGCCGGGGSSGGHDHMGHNGGNGQYGPDQMINQIEMVRDPECGMTVDPATAIKQNLNGKTYYFCSEACRVNFVRKNQGSL